MNIIDSVLKGYAYGYGVHIPNFKPRSKDSYLKMIQFMTGKVLTDFCEYVVESIKEEEDLTLAKLAKEFVENYEDDNGTYRSKGVLAFLAHCLNEKERKGCRVYYTDPSGKYLFVPVELPDTSQSDTSSPYNLYQSEVRREISHVVNSTVKGIANIGYMVINFNKDENKLDSSD